MINMVELRQLISEYKEITLDLIEKVKNDDELEEGIKRRNNILKKIKNTNHNEEEIKELLKKANVSALDNELELTIKKEMVKIKKKIENMRKAKNARKMYRANNQLEMKLFEKKI